MKKMNVFRGLCACLLLISAAAGLFVPRVYAQAQRPGMSRSMEQAIRLYHENEDTEAMDRFMDILTKGSPSEKALANEYINKITTRMNTGVPTLDDGRTEGGTVNVVQPKEKGVAGKESEESPSPAYEDEEESSGDRALQERDEINKKISDKIAKMRRDILLYLNNHSEAVQIYMGDGSPKAISLNTSYFFAAGTSFRAGTDLILTAVAGLVFTLGRTHCLILPEGSVAGDVKIQNIRRALALNSYLEARGVSKARLEVNLTGSDISFPKELTSIKGMIILFDYKKEPRLNDVEDIRSKGPRVSLGVYPTAIAVHKGEGAVVEFSVFESPAGRPSWSFQVFQVQDNGSRLQLQEISGSGPQYNQSFWNGRKKFFGARYPSGKYIFTVIAKDLQGRETSLSRYLAIRLTPEEEQAMAAKPARNTRKAAAAPSGAKPVTLKPGAGGKKGKLLKKSSRGGKAVLKKGKSAALRKKGVRKPAARKAVEIPEEEGAGAPPGAATSGKAAPPEGGEFSGQVSYKIYFKENTATITSNSEKKLAQVADTLGLYPMANIDLTGYAYSGEANAEVMAENRVNYVATRLTEKYKIEQARMDIKSRVSETPKSTVEIKMTGNE